MSGSRFWVAVSVMSATVMQVLDMTIINVALPHMSGELGATADSISWTLTSYLMASAVLMPLAGFFTDRLGRKTYLLASIAGFVVASALCGLANGLPEMVAFRLLQGVFGASLVPLSQAIMVETFPVESRGKAMAIWGMGVMVAPILGPSLGGYLTEVFSWRWTFYINVPIGIVSFILGSRFVSDTPVRDRKMDWLGFSTLAIAIAAAQLVLDRGAEKDWFDSELIVTATLAAIIASSVFVWKSLARKGHPVFELIVFKDRNFAVSCLIMMSSGLGVFGAQLLLPLLLETVLGFPTMEAGLYLMPRGIATFVSMSLVGRFSNRFSPRSMLALGIALSFAGALTMTRISPDAAGSILFVPMILQGLGMGLIFVPLASLAFSTLPARLAPEAAGLYSLMRTVGSSIGISVASTYLNYSTRVNWSELRAAITPYSLQAQRFLAPLRLHLDQAGAQVLANIIQHQALVKGFIGTFWLTAVSFAAMLPLLLLIRTVRSTPVVQIAME